MKGNCENVWNTAQPHCQHDVQGAVDKRKTVKLSFSICSRQKKPVGQQNDVFLIFFSEHCHFPYFIAPDSATTFGKDS